MVGKARAWAVSIAGLIACTTSLETPDGLRVRCADDGDCPSDRCSTAVGVCIAKDDDDSPLRIASVEALDSRHVLVLFNREVEPLSAGDFTVYGFSAGLSPEAAEVADDRLSVTVQTTQQRLRTYLLDVVDVVDPIGRPLERTQREFTGVGEPVNGQAPTPLAPLDRTLFADPSITLAWTSLVDAVNYSVEVVRLTEAGEVPIDGSPFVTRDNELTVVVASDATYAWRVAADTSREPPVKSSFAVFGEAVHVYCAAADDCSLADSWDAGTSTSPSRRIGRALALAALLFRNEVRIAGRGGSTAYQESFIVAPPLTRIAGGFDPSFTVADPLATPTIIQAAPNVVRVLSTQPVELVDLVLHATGGAALVLSAVDEVTGTRLTLLADQGRPLDVRRCTAGRPVTFAQLRAGGLPPFVNVAPARIAGACNVTFDGASMTDAGIEIIGASATFTDSAIVATRGQLAGSQDFQGLDMVAMLVDEGTVTLERSVLRAGVGGDSANHVALRVRDRSSVLVESSMLVAAQVSFNDCFPENCQGDAIAVEAGNPDGVDGLTVVVINSVLAASAAPATPDDTATTVRWVGPGTLALIHDVLYVEDGTALFGNAGQALGTDLEVLDSVLVCSGSSIGTDVITDVPPRLLRASAFVGCNTPYRRLGVSYMTAAAIEAISDPAPHAFLNLYVFAAPIAATFPQYAGADGIPATLDDDWSCGAACTSLGESSQDPVCGPDGADDCVAVVTVDSVGAMRTVPLSLGPREVD